MRKSSFLRLFLCLAVALFELPLMSQGIVVCKKDGTQVKFSYEEIDSIVTYNVGEAGSDDLGDTSASILGEWKATKIVATMNNGNVVTITDPEDLSYELDGLEWITIAKNNIRLMGYSYEIFIPYEISNNYIIFGGGETDATYKLGSVSENEMVIEYVNEWTSLIYYTRITKSTEGRVFVDLGLPSGLKWASCNVGAESPEEYGDYFAWGETSTKSDYTISNSITYGLSISELESRGIIDASGNLTAAYDAATVNWGGNWRMPTLDEIEELISECTWIWTTQSGVYGRKVTGPNGNSIFLPAAGYRDYESLNGASDVGYYWFATSDSSSNYACRLCFYSDFYYWSYDTRSCGQAVRPVSE